MPEFKKKKSVEPSPLEYVLKNKKLRVKSESSQNFTISLEDFDCTQKPGSGYRDWQKEGLLSTLLEMLTGYCKRPLFEQVDGKKFCVYGNFPPSDKTRFRLPLHIPPDAIWARIHVNNITVVAGHVIENTFYLVFLDKHHHFYLSKKPNT